MCLISLSRLSAFRSLLSLLWTTASNVEGAERSDTPPAYKAGRPWWTLVVCVSWSGGRSTAGDVDRSQVQVSGLVQSVSVSPVILKSVLLGQMFACGCRKWLVVCVA